MGGWQNLSSCKLPGQAGGVQKPRVLTNPTTRLTSIDSSWIRTVTVPWLITISTGRWTHGQRPQYRSLFFIQWYVIFKVYNHHNDVQNALFLSTRIHGEPNLYHMYKPISIVLLFKSCVYLLWIKTTLSLNDAYFQNKSYDV